MTRARRKTKEVKNQFNGVFFKGFVPQTKNQENYVISVANNAVSIIQGCSGTGKTYQAIGLACQYLLDGSFKKVLYSRSMISCDNEIGYIPGNVDEKCAPHFLSALDYFHHFIGKAKTESLVTYGDLKFFPVELIRGQTHNDTLMIVDECQNLTCKQLKLFLTRMGRGSKIIMLGDVRQSDIGYNGFEFCWDKMKDIPNVGLVELTKSDIMRHPIIGEVISVFENNGF